MAVVFVFLNYPFPEPEVDMRLKLAEELSSGYSIREYDWVVWSKTAKDSGIILTKMDSWEQFKEAYKQSFPVLVMMLDEQNCVVWFKAYANQAIYYEY